MPGVHPWWGFYWGEVLVGGIPYGLTPGTLCAKNMVPLYRMHTRLDLLCQRSALLCRGALPHTGTKGLGRSLHALDVPQGKDMTGKEGAEQEKESCRVPRGTLLHIPVSRSLNATLRTASPQASGKRHGHFKTDLFLSLDVLSSGEAVSFRGVTTPGLQRTWNTCPAFLASSVVPETGASLRSPLHPAKSPTPQLCAHIHPLQRVCSAAPRHGSMALEKDREEEAACLLLRQHFGQIQGSVRGTMGSLDKEAEGNSSPGQRACL